MAFSCFFGLPFVQQMMGSFTLVFIVYLIKVFLSVVGRYQLLLISTA